MSIPSPFWAPVNMRNVFSKICIISMDWCMMIVAQIAIVFFVSFLSTHSCILGESRCSITTLCLVCETIEYNHIALLGAWLV